jgi:hypothetical protein
LHPHRLQTLQILDSVSLLLRDDSSFFTKVDHIVKLEAFTGFMLKAGIFSSFFQYEES